MLCYNTASVEIYEEFGDVSIDVPGMSRKLRGVQWNGKKLKEMIRDKTLKKQFSKKSEFERWWKESGHWVEMKKKLGSSRWVDRLDLQLKAYDAYTALTHNSAVAYPMYGAMGWWSSDFRDLPQQSMKKRLFDTPIGRHEPSLSDARLLRTFFETEKMVNVDNWGQLFEYGRLAKVWKAFHDTHLQCVGEVRPDDRRKTFKMKFFRREEEVSQDIPKCGVIFQFDTLKDIMVLNAKTKKIVGRIFPDGSAVIDHKSIAEFVRRLNDEHEFLDAIQQKLGACCFCGRPIFVESSMAQGSGDVCNKKYASVWNRAYKYDPSADLNKNLEEFIDIGSEMIGGVLPSLFAEKSKVLQVMLDGEDQEALDALFEDIKAKFSTKTLTNVATWYGIQKHMGTWYAQQGMNHTRLPQNHANLHIYTLLFSKEAMELHRYLDLVDFPQQQILRLSKFGYFYEQLRKWLFNALADGTVSANQALADLVPYCKSWYEKPKNMHPDYYRDNHESVVVRKVRFILENTPREKIGDDVVEYVMTNALKMCKLELVKCMCTTSCNGGLRITADMLLKSISKHTTVEFYREARQLFLGFCPLSKLIEEQTRLDDEQKLVAKQQGNVELVAFCNSPMPFI